MASRVLRDPAADHGRRAPGPFPAHREGGEPSGRRRARLRRQRLRRHQRLRHARDPGLCAGRAGRFGARQGARQRALAITVLDPNGRRIGPRHDNWLQVRAGPGTEVQRLPFAVGSGISHGRDEPLRRANAGAPAHGVPFPNTNPAFFADFGETMAQVRARISCQTDCADLKPSTSIRFVDVWTDPVAAGRAPDAPFAYDYTDLTTPAPTTTDCVTGWRAGCRVTIHYERAHPSAVEQAAGNAGRGRHRAAPTTRA